MVATDIAEFIKGIPKAELHCHLEGSIQPATILTIAARNNIELPFSDEEGANEFFDFENFNQLT